MDKIYLLIECYFNNCSYSFKALGCYPTEKEAKDKMVEYSEYELQNHMYIKEVDMDKIIKKVNGE